MSSNQTRGWRRVALAGVVAGTFSLGLTTAFAGECPADQQRPDGSGQKVGATAPKDVTDVVIATTDLSKEKVALKDRLFRARRLDIKPGGIVPWHSHADRPAMIYMLEGEMTEYTSTCNVPVVLSAGEVVAETHVVSHWWQNHGKKTAVVLSFDILHNPGDAHMM